MEQILFDTKREKIKCFIDNFNEFGSMLLRKKVEIICETVHFNSR